MRLLFPLALAALLAGGSCTSTPWNPNCEKYPYLDACQNDEEG